MVHKPPFYYQEDDATPICVACWETKKLAVHVIFDYDSDRETRWDCPTCKQMFLIRKNASRLNPLPRGPSDNLGWMR